MSKQNVDLPDLNLMNSVGLSESKDVRIMEQIIKRYIANLEYISQEDKLGSKYPIRDYLEDIVTFVSEYNLARSFLLLINYNAAKEVWRRIRENDSITAFLFHVTSEFKLVLGQEEFINTCHRIAYAYDYISNGRFNIIKDVDEELARSLPKNFATDYDLVKFLEENSWFVTIILINMMNPLII